MNAVTSPEVVAELKRIAEANDGLLLPELVVDAARPSDSPLHSRFTWDNGEAARKYRMWQARQLISVSVEYLGAEKKGESVRVFVSLTTDRVEESGGYRKLTTVLSDADMRRQLLADALAELAVFEKKYARLKELAKLFEDARKLRKKFCR